MNMVKGCSINRLNETSGGVAAFHYGEMGIPGVEQWDKKSTRGETCICSFYHGGKKNGKWVRHGPIKRMGTEMKDTA